MAGRDEVIPSSRFLRFGLVGCLGYVVDVSVLYAFLSLAGRGLLMGRAISFLTAATTTWYINRLVTFSGSSRNDPFRQWGKFLLCNSFGGIVNYSLYTLLVIGSDFMADLPFLAVGCGSLAGLVINYTLSKIFVFQDSSCSVEVR